MDSSADDHFPYQRPPAPDGVSCVGILLLVIMLLFTLGVAMNRPAVGSAAVAPSPTAAALAFGATPFPTLQPLAAVTSTHTPAPTQTASATATVPPPNTATAVPPTAPPPATWTPAPLPTAAATLAAWPILDPASGPLPTPIGVYSRTLRVPILMYHYISTPPDDADIYRVDLSVSPENFRIQMEYLVHNGYTAIDLYDLSRAITHKQELPPRPVIITVDDGYRDFYEVAFPILRELGLTATVFVITDLLDQNHPGYLTWPMVVELAAAGMRIEPHSKNHVNLDGRDRDHLIWQMLGSQETVAAHLGYRPRFFAYPAGRYDDLAIEVLHQLGFWGSVTTRGGAWHGFTERFEWTRLRVRNTTTLERYIDMLE